MYEIIFTAVCVAAAVIMLIYHLTRKRKLRSMLYGAITGLAALFILAHFGGGFNAGLPLNVFNILGSAVLGVPFVICEVVLKIL